jgi:Tfp pilus assembly protein PilN
MRAVNLIPSEQREGASVGAGRSEGGAYALLGLLAGIAVLALFYGMAKHEVTSQRTQAASLTAQAQSAQAEASKLASYTSFVALREQREQAVSTLVASRFDWAHAFHEFGRTVPPGVSFTSLNGSIAPAAAGATGAAPAAAATPAAAAATSSVASSTPPGSVPTFSLSGCAISQETVARMLIRMRLIDGVSNVTLQSSAASASGGSSSTGGCPANGPTFAMTVTFAPLPTPAVTPASTSSTVSDTAAAGSPAAPATSESSSK